MTPATFGARFLTEFRRLGGSTKDWPPQAVAVLAAADRRKFITLLESRSSKIGSELIVAAHTAEPETLARRAFAHRSVQQAQAGGGDFVLLLGVIATLSGS
jgi:hypothetical protein